MVDESVLAAFCGSVGCEAKPLGMGHINATYLVKGATESLVLQRINDQVFPDPETVVSNFVLVSNHIDTRQSTLFAVPELQIARPVMTIDGAPWHRDVSGAYWRAQSYIVHRPGYLPQTDLDWRRLGRALAAFHRLAEQLDRQSLGVPLPGFHFLPGYLDQFDLQAARTAYLPDGRELDYCLETVVRYRHRAWELEEAGRAGIIPIQPVHGDPKADNFLFPMAGGPCGLVDLDTTAAGLIHYDLGDMLRSCCNRGAELAEGDGDVGLDLRRFGLILGGYFSLAGRTMSVEAEQMIVDSLVLVSFELGLRFLTDHLAGDVYFKVAHQGDNLIRSYRMFRFLADVARREGHLRAALRQVAC